MTPRTQTLVLPVPPSANRWHRVVNGRPILSAEARAYTAEARALARQQGVQRIGAPADVEMSIVWYRAKRSGDVDKRAAVLIDALGASRATKKAAAVPGILYDNDAQIRRFTIERNDSERETPRMVVTVAVLGDVQEGLL